MATKGFTFAGGGANVAHSAGTFGVPTDGTDAAAAITAIPPDSGIVWFDAPATCLHTVYVPSGVELRSLKGRSGAILKASALGTYDTIAGSQWLAVLGNAAGDFAFGTQIRGEIDCASVAGLRAVYARNIQERSGLFEFLIANVMATPAVFIDGNNGKAPQNWAIRSGEIYFDPTISGVSCIGIDANLNGNNFRSIEDVTIVARAASVGPAAIRLNGVSGGAVRDIHAEQFTDAVLVGDLHACSAVVGENFRGASSLTNVVHIAIPGDASINTGLSFDGISPLGATNALKDDEMGRTAASSSNGGGGYYRRGNGTIGTQTIETNLTGAGSPRLALGLNVPTAAVNLGVGLIETVSLKTANYTISGDPITVFTISGATTATLPNAAAAGTRGAIRIITNASASTSALTVASAGGTVPVTSLAAGASARYVSDGTNWQLC